MSGVSRIVNSGSFRFAVDPGAVTTFGDTAIVHEQHRFVVSVLNPDRSTLHMDHAVKWRNSVLGHDKIRIAPGSNRKPVMSHGHRLSVRLQRQDNVRRIFVRTGI